MFVLRKHSMEIYSLLTIVRKIYCKFRVNVKEKKNFKLADVVCN